MKPITKILLGLCCAGTLLYSSCGKDYKNTASPVSYTNQNELNIAYSDLRTTSQTFTVTAGIEQSIAGTGGTKIKFYPNSFKNANGTIITSGSVTVKLIEMNNAGSMIANRASTMCNGEPLISGGQVNITATLGGKEVYANKYSIGFKQAAASTMPMQLFYGNTSNADSIVQWSAADTNGDSTGTYASSTDVNLYYQFDSCTSFNFINCDRFYAGPPGGTTTYTKVKVVLSDTSYKPYITQVFLVLPSINSVINMYVQNPTTRTYYLPKIPRGLNAKIVVMSVKSPKYYYGSRDTLTINDSTAIPMNLTEKTIPQIKTLLFAL